MSNIYITSIKFISKIIVAIIGALLFGAFLGSLPYIEISFLNVIFNLILLFLSLLPLILFRKSTLVILIYCLLSSVTAYFFEIFYSQEHRGRPGPPFRDANLMDKCPYIEQSLVCRGSDLFARLVFAARCSNSEYINLRFNRADLRCNKYD
jgi:hypothetical protein